MPCGLAHTVAPVY